MPPCNCGANKTTASTFQWTSPSGEKKVFSTRDAAVLKTARDGGSWKEVKS